MTCFRGQMISQEDYNFIYQFDNANAETKAAVLKEAGPQVTRVIPLYTGKIRNSCKVTYGNFAPVSVRNKL